MTQPTVDQRIIELYHDFTHGGMNRRAFLERLAAMAGSAAAAAALLPFLQNDYAKAETIAKDDPRIVTGKMSVPEDPASLTGYLAQPKAAGKHGAVLVIHENRGLNPHIEDVTRRVAVAGFTALGLDYLSLQGGTPADEDKARDMIGTLKPADLVAWSRAAVSMLAYRPECNGKVGVLGFCWGGGLANQLAVAEPTLAGAVVYYGMQPKADQVPAIKAPLLLQYGSLDTTMDPGIPAFEAVLKANHKDYEIHMYEGANHAFNNDTGGRYDKAAADLAWTRTIDFFNKHLA